MDFIQNTPFSFNYWGGVIGAFPSSVCPRASCGFTPYGCFSCGSFSSPSSVPFWGNGRGGFFLFEHQFATGRVALRRLDVEDENFLIASGEGGELHLLCATRTEREEAFAKGREDAARRDAFCAADADDAGFRGVNGEGSVGGGESADFRNDGGVALREVFTNFIDNGGGVALPADADARGGACGGEGEFLVASRQRAEADPFAIRCRGADDGVLRGGAGSLEDDDAGGRAGIVEMVGQAVARGRVGGGDARVASLVGQAEEGVARGIGSGVLELGSVGGLVDFNVVEAQPLGGVGRGDKEAYVLRGVVRAAEVAIGHFAGILDDLGERHAEIGLRGAFHAERFPGFAIEGSLYAANGHVVAVHCSHADSDVANGDGS